MKMPEELQFMVNARLPQKRTDARLDGKVCVLTGATSGVGYSAARRLARSGAHLVLVCRNRNKAERATAGTAAGIRGDRRNHPGGFFPTWTRCAPLPRSFSPPTRASISWSTTPGCIIPTAADGGRPRDGFLRQPPGLLPAHPPAAAPSPGSAPARILQVNSQGHRFGGLDLDDLDWARRRYHGLQGYGASKVAQLLTVWELADRLEGTGVTINAMHPGEVRTNIGMNNGRLYQLVPAPVDLANPEGPAHFGRSHLLPGGSA